MVKSYTRPWGCPVRASREGVNRALRPSAAAGRCQLEDDATADLTTSTSAGERRAIDVTRLVEDQSTAVGIRSIAVSTEFVKRRFRPRTVCGVTEGDWNLQSVDGAAAGVPVGHAWSIYSPKSGCTVEFAVAADD